jgi:hypothetical protein
MANRGLAEQAARLAETALSCRDADLQMDRKSETAAGAPEMGQDLLHVVDVFDDVEFTNLWLDHRAVSLSQSVAYALGTPAESARAQLHS